jgi:LuxR family maltose regulon positive regulatory protein
MVLLARALVVAGDIDAAVSAYEASLPDLREGGNVLAVGRAIGDLAMIALSRGDRPAAIRLCEAEIERQPGETSASASPAVWLALARAREDQGEVEMAASAARRAVELAVRAGDAQVARSARATLARLEPVLARRRPDGPSGDAAGVVARAAGLVEPLTPRELEVLRLVALGRSNAAIAAELFVTVGTVKSHVHAVSGKLGAANRVEAVARARELGILP